jgi:hypothetical protein
MQHDQPEMKFLIKYEKLFEMWSIDLVWGGWIASSESESTPFVLKSRPFPSSENLCFNKVCCFKHTLINLDLAIKYSNLSCKQTSSTQRITRWDDDVFILQWLQWWSFSFGSFDY